MSNLFDNLVDALGRNKRNLVYAILAYLVVVISIVIYIWWPKDKNYLQYEKVDIEAKQEVLAQEYIDEVSLLFRTGDKQAVKDLISEEYVNFTGKTRDELINELDSQGYFDLYSEMRGIDLFVDEDTYVYTTTIHYKNNSKSINIVEVYPYEYELVFDDFYKYSKLDKTTTNQDIKFTINDIYRNLKYIEINMKIENLNKSYVRFDFNSSTCVQAVLDDGKKYSVSNLVSTSNYTDVESNTTISKNFVFEIPAQLQNKIQYIIFNGVILEFSEANIKVEI